MKTGNKADSCAPRSWRGEAVRQVLALDAALLNATGHSFPCQLQVIKEERRLDGVERRCRPVEKVSAANEQLLLPAAAATLAAERASEIQCLDKPAL